MNRLKERRPCASGINKIEAIFFSVYYDKEFPVTIPTLPEPVLLAITLLEQASFEAYLVGGGLRDSLLGLQSEDYDLTTDATPDEMKYVFSGYRIHEIGIDHGTLQVIIKGMPLEITTYRSDGLYLDHRHPQSVRFSRSLSEDLARRDFTVNAMAFHPKKGLIDLYGGRQDLQNRCLRAVGDPLERFHEDALRILRALRLASKLDFSIESATSKALFQESRLLSCIASERILKELLGILKGKAAGRIIMDYFSVLLCVMPELNEKDAEAIAKAVEQVRSVSHCQLAALFHRTRPDERKNMMKRLRMDKRTSQKVLKVLEGYSQPLPQELPAIRRFAGQYRDVLRDIISLKEATSDTQHLPTFKKKIKVIVQRRDPLSLDDLAVDGEDLLQEGIPNGPEIGYVLDKLLELVYEDPSKNTRRSLLAYASEVSKNGSQ